MPNGDGGYAMGALLVAIAAMGVMMSVALPVWNQVAKREREAELRFRGEQYARAVELYQRTYAAAYPEDVDALLEERFLRRRYRDPMTADGEFRVVYEAEVGDLLQNAPISELPGQPVARPDDENQEADEPDAGAGGEEGQSPRLELDDEPPPAGSRGGVVGVVSLSDEASLLIYNGATKYSDWLFLHTPQTAEPGEGGPGGRAAGLGGGGDRGGAFGSPR